MREKKELIIFSVLLIVDYRLSTTYEHIFCALSEREMKDIFDFTIDRLCAMVYNNV
jgi:hypothetical protein